MINPVELGYTVEQVRSSYSSTPSTTEQTDTNRSGDTVTISNEAALMSKLQSMPSLDDLDELTERLQGRIETLFLENGISMDPPVELTSDSQGAIRVKGDHPDKEKIEQLFADNPDLANDFRQVSAMTSLKEAAEEHMKFAKAYAQDPYAAVIQYGYLFNDMRISEPYSMTIGAEEAA